MARHIKKLIRVGEDLVESDHYHNCTIIIPNGTEWDDINFPETGCYLNCHFIWETYYLVDLLTWIRG